MRDVGLALIAAGLPVGVAALVALHLLPTGLSPVRSPVSQYGICPYRLGYRVQTIAYALAGLGAALGAAAVPSSTWAVVALLAVFALARAAISWFPMDRPGGQRTETGRRHGLLAIAAFGAVTIAANRLAAGLDRARIHPSLAGASAGLGVAMLAALVGMGLDRRGGGRHFGLIERGFYGCCTAWLVVVALLLARS